MGQIYSTSSSQRSEDDGSDRERVTSSMSSMAPRKPCYYIAPLLDESTCPILDIPINSLENIFSLMSLTDLSRFSQTCKHFNVAVGEFLRHQCCAAESLLKEQHFVTRLGQLATRSELIMLEEIQKSFSQDEGEESCLSRAARYKLLHHNQMFEQMNHNRISVCDERVNFPHRGTNHYIVVEEDTILKRQIATVRHVCWLEINHTFPVTPGMYSVSLRVRINHGNFRWPHTDRDATIFSITYPSSSGHDSCSVRVYKNWWKALNEGWAPTVRNVKGISVTWEKVEGDRTGWVSVTMDPVTVTEEGRLVFQMKDVECPHWKSGLSFDFLQLTKH